MTKVRTFPTIWAMEGTAQRHRNSTPLTSVLLVLPLPSGPTSPRTWAHFVEVGARWAEEARGAFHLLALEAGKSDGVAKPKRLGPITLLRRQPCESWTAALIRALATVESEWVVIASDIVVVRPDWLDDTLHALSDDRTSLLQVWQRSPHLADEPEPPPPVVFATTRDLARRALGCLAGESVSFPFAGWLANVELFVPPDRRKTVICRPGVPGRLVTPAEAPPFQLFRNSSLGPHTGANQVVHQCIRALILGAASGALLLLVGSIPQWLKLLAAWTVVCTVVGVTTLWVLTRLVLRRISITSMVLLLPNDGRLASRFRSSALLCLVIGVSLAVVCLPWADSAVSELWRLGGFASAAALTVVGIHALAWSRVFDRLRLQAPRPPEDDRTPPLRAPCAPVASPNPNLAESNPLPPR